MPFSIFNKTLEKLPTTGFPQVNTDGSTLPLMSDDELADATAGAEAFLDGTPQDAASSHPPISQDESMVDGQVSEVANGLNEGQTQERSVHVKEEEPVSPLLQSFRRVEDTSSKLGSRPNGPVDGHRTFGPTTSLEQLDGSMTSPPPSHDLSSQLSSSNEDLAPCKLTLDDIRPHIPAEGIKLKDLKNFFDKDQLPSNRIAKKQFWSLVYSVAENKDDRYYLKPASLGSSQQPRQSQSMTLAESQQKVEVAAEQQVADVKPTKVEHEPESSPHKENNPFPTQLQQFQTPPSSSGRKRPASSMATSRESTPSKKPRFSELSSKKADLLKSIEVKKQRKLQAKKELEQAEKLREEAEMREIKMLEKMAADEDEEYEDLIRAKEEQEADMEEARVARERAEGALRASEEA
ncbi:hypothetical protein LTR85_010392 [Meristemomyces frigidus]|nr:hypothetical protein LTR85_010392 [Meristemomyces frigidus]